MRESLRIIVCILLLIFTFSKGIAQSSCPDNIGFERGSFTNWDCFGGIISAANGVTGLVGPAPMPGRHTIIQNTVPQELDFYGNFPVNCPNGSGYSIKLGNADVSNEADRVSYTFTVPIDKDEYSIIYNYAIVFQDPGHSPEEQPRFTSRVYDETAGEYLSCGSFEYVASSILPGFQLSTQGTGVYYKSWSPVTVKLYNCAGKTITIEFTVNDCTRGGHFGYAYLDVNENCSSPITGNVYCNGTTVTTLTAPFGFKEYEWYTSDFSTLLGTMNTLHLNPIPPVGTEFALIIKPYPGVGCPDTLYTTIELSDHAFQFVLQDTLNSCSGYPADLTTSNLSQGSSQGLTFSYFIDSTALQYLPTPTYVLDEDTYYVKAVNAVGCTETKPIAVVFKTMPLVVGVPADGCYPNTIDITGAAITSGSDPTLNLSYWIDNQATIPITNPAAIDTTGTYFIKGSNDVCNHVVPVSVRIWNASNFSTQPMIGCGTVDLTGYDVTAGSTPIFQFSQWKDISATVPVTNPQDVRESGTYYIKALLNSGCSFVKPVQVTINPSPVFSITDPASVTAPFTADITRAASSLQNILSYTYWTNEQATTEITRPNAINRSGIYYIKATDTFGCATIKPVNVSVIIPYHPFIDYPNAFSPNKDGINDGFRITVAGDITFKTFRIYDRWGRMLFQTNDPFEYWYGTSNGKDAPVGTYYWIMELVNNNNQDFYRKTGTITLLR